VSSSSQKGGVSSPAYSSSPSVSCPTSPEKSLSSDGTSGLPKCHILNGVHVIDWTTDHVCMWLTSLGLEVHATNFKGNGVNGQVLLQLDSSQLKSLGVVSVIDRSVVKKKIRDMKHEVEKERKALEKELKIREKQKQKDLQQKSKK